MTLQSLADHELRSLVRYGSPKFAALAEAELKRREALNQEDRGLKVADGVLAAAYPEGLWS
jgi:hypothetical protein